MTHPNQTTPKTQSQLSLDDQIDLANAAGMLETAGDYLTTNMTLTEVLCGKVQGFESLFNDLTTVLEQAREDAGELRAVLESQLALASADTEVRAS